MTEQEQRYNGVSRHTGTDGRSRNNTASMDSPSRNTAAPARNAASVRLLP